MEFLPSAVEGEPVYVGPLRRLAAYLLDGVILSPLLVMGIFLRKVSSDVAAVSGIVYFVVAQAYFVTFAGLLGATPGKLAVGIRITKPDGSHIGWSEALKRQAVTIALAGAAVVAALPYYLSASPAELARMTAAARVAYRRSVSPASTPLVWLSGAWFYADAGTLIFNSRHRALHDFIAGTVVVHKRFAEQAHPADARHRSVD